MNGMLTITNRKGYARRALLFLTLMLFLRWWSGRYLTFLAGQPLKGPDTDWTFWLVLLSGIPQFLIQHLWACKISDGLVVFSVFAAWFFPGDRRIFIFLLAALFINHITVETYSVTHTKTSAILYLSILPLCFREEHFGMLAEFVRYVVVFVLVSAAWYKLHNGALMDPEHFKTVLINQHADLALLRPEQVSFLVSQWLVGHPFIAWLCFIGLFLIQSSFLLGVFTKKYDQFLCLGLLIFAMLTYLLMRISVWEILAGGLVFLVGYERLKS